MANINNTGKKIEAIYSLTPLQEGMLFNNIMNLQNEGNSYLCQHCMDINGDLSFELYSKALELLAYRYDVFRTVFLYDKIENPKQVVLKDRLPETKFYNLENLGEEEKIKEYVKIKNEDLKRGIDLQKDVMLRSICIKNSEKSYKILLTMHHIIIDGWCLSIILKSLCSL